MTPLNKGGLIFILCRYLCTNKHNIHTRLWLCPCQIYSCPCRLGNLFTLIFFCSVVHHFSIFQARTHQAIIQDLRIPCHSDISRGNKKGLFFKRGDKTPGFYTQILTRVPLSCPFIHNCRGGVGERESRGKSRPTVPLQVFSRCRKWLMSEHGCRCSPLVY